MNWVRDDIKDLKEYKENNSPYKIKLDANEGENLFFNNIDDIDLDVLKEINRYPDSSAKKLRDVIGSYMGVNPDNIIAGNGSSEMIELVMKTFVEKGDKILSFIPTFAMYGIFSQIYSAEFIGIEGKEESFSTPRDNFSVDMDILIKKAREINPKLILVCNPNNPTGELISKEDIDKLLKNTDALVVLDEAYIEFADGSMVDEIDNYDNLIVLRTLSKAIGLAGIRLGYMISNREVIDWVNKVKAPYSLNSLTQAFAIMAIDKSNLIEEYIKREKIEREKMYNDLKALGLKVYPSSTNFILFYSGIENLDQEFQNDGILVRAFGGDLAGYYRVTIGNEYENREFVKSLKEILKNEKS